MLSTWDDNDKKGYDTDIVCSYSIFCGEGVKATEKHCVCWMGGNLEIRFNIIIMKYMQLCKCISLKKSSYLILCLVVSVKLCSRPGTLEASVSPSEVLNSTLGANPASC